MQFIKDKEFYKVARITGPNHNFLAIRLSENECSPKIVSLPIKDKEIAKVDGKEVLKQVQSGLLTVNQELKQKYFVSEIQFVPSDTESTCIYEFLIQELIKRIHSGEEFATAK